MKKKRSKLLAGILTICCLMITQSVSCALNVSFGDNINNGSGTQNIAQTSIGSLIFNVSNVQPFQLGLTNEDLVQVFVNDKYFAYDKDQADDYIPQTILNSFKPSQLRGWSSSSGYQFVLLGRYIQDYVDQPILWRVLGVNNGKALLLSEYILDTRSFDDNSNVWETSDLRTWLNGDFYSDAFSQSERNAIVDNGKLGKVFILSDAELSNSAYGFNSNKYVEDTFRRASGSMYAYSNNLWNVADSDFTNYYVRSKPNDINVGLITSRGVLMDAKITRDNVGIRPAVWVNVNQLPFTNGDGGIAYPFQ
jgi:hypothetical protein